MAPGHHRPSTARQGRWSCATSIEGHLVGLERLRQHFIEPVRENAKEIAAAGVVAGLAAVLGADDEVPPSDGGAGPSQTMRRVRWVVLGVIAVLVVVFVVGGLLR